MPRCKPTRFLGAAALIPLVALGVAGCGTNGPASKPAATPTNTSGKHTTVSAESNPKLGNILVDSQGRTLYLFAQDAGPTSTCSGECASNWPPLRVSAKPTVSGAANASAIGTTKRSDGDAQVTYDGHPLYLFQGDQQAGETNGQALNAFGAKWYAVSPAGSKITKASGSGNSGGSAGY